MSQERERARYSCWVGMNGAGYIYRPMHAHMLLPASEEPDIPTHSFPKQNKQTRTTVLFMVATRYLSVFSESHVASYGSFRCNCHSTYRSFKLVASLGVAQAVGPVSIFEIINNKYNNVSSRNASIQTSPRSTASRTILVSV